MEEEDLEIVEIFEKRQQVPMSHGRRNRLAQRSLAIDRIKKCRKVGYELHKLDPDRRPRTPYIADPCFEQNFSDWKKAITLRNHSDTTLISKQDLEYMISEIKKDEPYAEYHKHAKLDLRSVKTPEPRDMTGREWKHLFDRWIRDLRDRLRKPDFELAIMRNSMSHKKGWENPDRPKTPERADFETYDEYLKKVDEFTSTIKQLHNQAVCKSKLELPKPVPKDVNLEKPRENRNGSYTNKDLKERSKLLKTARQSREFKYFEARTNMFKNQELPSPCLQIDQEVWVVMLEKALSKMRQNMKCATNEEWWKKRIRETLSAIKNGEAYQSVASFSLSRPKTPDIEQIDDFMQGKELTKVWKKAILSEKKKLMMPLGQRITEDIKEIKHSDMYLAYAKASHEGKAPRVKTPDTFAILTLADWQSSCLQWKNELEGVTKNIMTPLISQREIDVRQLKKSDLYLDFNRARQDGKIKRDVKSPDPKSPHYNSMHQWEKAYQSWRNELREALEDSNLFYFAQMQSGSSQKPKVNEMSKPVSFHPIIKEEVNDNDLKIDLEKIATLDPDTELMSYVRNLSINYANAIDQKHSKTRGFVGSLVGDESLSFSPCGAYNKDNSCPFQSTLHPDKLCNYKQSIHSCILCYFVLKMINMHRLPKCPLLAYL